MTTSNGKSAIEFTEQSLTHYKPEYNTDGTEKHINLEGARYHVLWWDAQGVHCSEKNCEVNKREPFGYWHQGESIEESDFHLFADMPNSDEDCAQCRPLFTRPPSTSQRELELLGVIEQMREALTDASKHLSYYDDEKTLSHVNKRVREALALMPDMWW